MTRFAPRFFRHTPTLALALSALLPSGAAQAADAPPPENIVNFAATATLEVPRDLLSVTLQATREGADAGVVQAQLKQALEAALAEARKTAQPGALDLRTGGFAITPRHGRDGRINGWQGQAELVLEGTDTARVAQAAGRLSGLNVIGTQQALSRPLREQHEAALTAQAIQKFRGQASEIARQFGFAGYVLREVSVSLQEAGGMPAPMMRLRVATAMAEDAALPTEAGKGLLTATVQGSVLLTR